MCNLPADKAAVLPLNPREFCGGDACSLVGYIGRARLPAIQGDRGRTCEWDALVLVEHQDSEGGCFGGNSDWFCVLHLLLL
eukprot:6480519-Amphidinium_carterae.1